MMMATHCLVTTAAVVLVVAKTGYIDVVDVVVVVKAAPLNSRAFHTLLSAHLFYDCTRN